MGLEQRLIDGVVSIPVTSVAKTVADCFKFRNKIGVDIAIEALRDAWIQRKATMDGLWEAAEWCRMTRVMRPYLESLV
jgi:predicted transcriptional regulator of viral defense system